jgi:5'-3' exonuclease
VTKTLIIDANNLLKIGFHGVKDYYHEGKHIGGIWHFLNTLRKFIEEYNYEKVLVFCDGECSRQPRKLIYPQYKETRREDNNPFKEISFNHQRERIKQYLEEMFIRQVCVENNEADDLISYYCQISNNEQITIFSGDRDLTQLISERVSVYSPNAKKTYKFGDKIKLYEIEVPHSNIPVCKVLIGDKSDNIDGIYYLGEKTLIKLFPEILDEEVNLTDILKKAETLFETDKDNNVLKNLLTGKTKTGIYGNEFFEINEKIVNLSKPIITDEGKTLVELYYSETLDPDGRGHRNIIKMMIEDGFFKYLPKNDDAFVEFLKPFMKLSRKEKRKFKQSN